MGCISIGYLRAVLDVVAAGHLFNHTILVFFATRIILRQVVPGRGRRISRSSNSPTYYPVLRSTAIRVRARAISNNPLPIGSICRALQEICYRPLIRALAVGASVPGVFLVVPGLGGRNCHILQCIRHRGCPAVLGATIPIILCRLIGYYCIVYTVISIPCVVIDRTRNILIANRNLYNAILDLIQFTVRRQACKHRQMIPETTPIRGI